MFATLPRKNTTDSKSDNMNVDDDCLCSFARQDTYLHTFGIKNGNNLMKLLYSRITICLLLLYGLFCIMLAWTHLIANYYLFLCLFGFINWIWITFAILSVNKMALHLITKKFDFWVKIICSIIFAISYSIWNILSHSQQNNQTDVLFISHTILIGMDFILFITYYSMINGIQIKYKTKLYLGILLSSMTTIVTFQLLLYTTNNSIRVNMDLYGNYLSISWYDLTLSSMQILNIFLWKTVYLFRKYRTKSTIVNTIPSIKWIESKPLNVSSLSSPPSSKQHLDNTLEPQQLKLPHSKDKQNIKSSNNDTSPNDTMNTMDIEITQSNNDNNCLYLDVDSVEFNPNHPKPLPLLPLITDTANRTEEDDPSLNDIPSFNNKIYSNTELQLEMANKRSNQSRSAVTPTPRSVSIHNREDRNQYNIIELIDNHHKKMRFPSNQVSPNYLTNTQQTPNHFSPSTAL